LGDWRYLGGGERPLAASYSSINAGSTSDLAHRYPINILWFYMGDANLKIRLYNIAKKRLLSIKGSYDDIYNQI
jgi:hypothetical protein